MLNFMGIGAQKCGTTWLCRTLARHPEISFPAGKEVFFWDKYRERGLDWYKGKFPDNGKVNGEITPAYALLPDDVVASVKENFPALRLIYVIRNPVDRAWSAARMMLARSEMLHTEASDQWFLDVFKSTGSLGRGDYESTIRRWRSAFGDDALLILRFEDLCVDPVGFANICLDHIGVPGFRFSAVDEFNLMQKQHKGDGVDIRPDLAVALHSLYDEKTKRLGEYLKADLSSWLKDGGL